MENFSDKFHCWLGHDATGGWKLINSLSTFGQETLARLFGSKTQLNCGVQVRMTESDRERAERLPGERRLLESARLMVA